MPHLGIPQRKLFAAWLAAVLLFTFVSGTAFAQPWAKKMFKEFEHDFGTVAKNELAEHRFEITNIFNEDIKIERIKTSCTCTDISITKKVLKKNETSELVAVFNTRNFVGPKQATVTVTFAAPYSAEVLLTVRGNIRGDVMFEPGAIDFGSLNQESIVNKSSMQRIQITKFNNVNWQIVDVKSTFPHIGVSLSNPMRIGNQVKYDMDVRIKESAPAGFAQGELIIVANDFGRQTNIPVRFTAKVASALQISPEILTISATEQGETIKKKIIIKGSEPFMIKDVTCSNESFAVSADAEAKKKVHFVNVEYSVDQAPGRYEYDLEFVTDLNERTTAMMKAVVEIAPAAKAASEQVDN